MLRDDRTLGGVVAGHIHGPPQPAVRRRVSWFVSLLLLSQLVLPLHYYVARREVPTAERFAWRMFSTIHMTQWQCRVVETIATSEGPVEIVLPLDAMLEESTVAALHAGQLDYARQLLSERMKRPEVVKVEYEARGRLPNGRMMPPIRLVRMRDPA